MNEFGGYAHPIAAASV